MRVALVGCGRMGRKRVAALGADTLVACLDADPEQVQEFATAHGAEACNDLAALLAHRPEAVIVATTPDALADAACGALEAGSHVLVEKPGGASGSDVERLVRAAAQAGRHVQVGFNHRFHPAVARAVAEARSGRFGPVLSLRGRYGHGGRPGYEREWRFDRAVAGGGQLVDQGMHLLDISHWLLGPPDVEIIDFPEQDPSWTAEWQAFRTAALAGAPAALDSTRYAWSVVEQAYAAEAAG